MASGSKAVRSRLTQSEEQWLRVRAYLRDNRHRLAVEAGGGYPDAAKVSGTPLLTVPNWYPTAPIPLDAVELEYWPEGDSAGVTGTEEAAWPLLPVRADGTRYHSFSEALAELAPPDTFQNRSTYRLLQGNLTTAPHLVFGRGHYFDGIDVGEACAHEYAATVLGEHNGPSLRALVGDPRDPGRRRMNMAISALTLRSDPVAGKATFPLHRRGTDTVGHAGGLYQVLPVGVFQPASDEPWNTTNDFSVWRCMVREYAEELLGESEYRGADQAPIDYEAWPFASQMTRAMPRGLVRAHCLGLGVDPLTLATDLLVAVVFDATMFDEFFGALVANNAEGSVLAAVPFEHTVVERFVSKEPMQAAGAALLALAWQHRRQLLGQKPQPGRGSRASRRGAGQHSGHATAAVASRRTRRTCAMSTTSCRAARRTGRLYAAGPDPGCGLVRPGSPSTRRRSVPCRWPTARAVRRAERRRYRAAGPPIGGRPTVVARTGSSGPPALLVA
jgi:hypothetical protein